MSRQIIVSDKVAPPHVPLSRAVRTGNLVFVSGTSPLARDGSVVEGNFEAQLRQVMQNLTHMLEAAGSSLSKAVKVNVILTRESDFQTMNAIYRTYFEESNFPARTTIVAKLSNPKFLLEIECVAAV